MVALSAGLLVGPGTVPASALPAAKPDATAGTNGTIYAVLQVGGRIYLGGKFDWAGPLTGNGALTRTSDGSRFATAAKPNGIVRAAVADPLGGWYVAGDFTKIGKTKRASVARINGKGGLASAWKPVVQGSVRALAVADGVLYLGGSFTSVGGQARANLAAVDRSGAVLPWNPGANGPVSALAVAPGGGSIYVGGSFGQAGGASRANVAAISIPAATASTWNPGANGPVEALATSPDGSQVYVGGSFGQAGGATRANVAAIDATSAAAVAAWSADTDGAVRSLATAPDGTVYAGGSFSSIGGASRSGLASLAAASGAVGSFDPSPNGPVYAVALSGDGARLFVGGGFSSIGGAMRPRAAAVSTTTGAADGFDPRADAIVRTVAPAGTKAYVGGDFRMLNGAPRKNVAALDAATGEVDLGWDANANAKLRALAASPDGQTIYLGGSFFKVGGLPRNKVAAVSASTGTPTSWKPSANGEVRALAASGDTVWVGGAFTQIGGTGTPHLAAIGAASGEVLPGFSAGADGQVRALDISPDGTKLYAGGDFRQLGGANRQGIAELIASTGSATSFAPADGGVVLDVELSPDGRYLYFCTTSNRTHRYEPAASNTSLWSMHSGGDVQAIGASADAVYLGGHFTKFTTQNVERRRIGAVAAADASVLPWNPKTNSFYGPWAIEVVDGAVLVGGDFTSTGGTQQFYFARFSGTP